MKTILVAILLLVTMPTFAASGVWYNPDRSGEGIYQFDSNGARTFAFFTYWDTDRLSGLLWFTASDPIDTDGVSAGYLYMTESTTYPECPNGSCADIRPIGEYIMEPLPDGGFSLTIENLPGNEWTESIFGSTYRFTAPLVIVNKESEDG